MNIKLVMSHLIIIHHDIYQVFYEIKTAYNYTNLKLIVFSVFQEYSFTKIIGSQL